MGKSEQVHDFAQTFSGQQLEYSDSERVYVVGYLWKAWKRKACSSSKLLLHRAQIFKEPLITAFPAAFKLIGSGAKTKDSKFFQSH